MSESDRKAAFQIAKDTYFEHLCSKLSELGFKRQGKKRIVRRVEQGKQGITVFQEKYRGYDSGYILFTAFFDFPEVNTIAAYIQNIELRKGFKTVLYAVCHANFASFCGFSSFHFCVNPWCNPLR